MLFFVDCEKQCFIFFMNVFNIDELVLKFMQNVMFELFSDEFKSNCMFYLFYE